MKKRELLQIPMPDVKFPKIDIEAFRQKHGKYFNAYLVTACTVEGEFGDTESETVTKANGTIITNPAIRYRSEKPSGILCVWLRSHIGTLRYSIFACADSGVWHVYDHNSEKWRTAMLRNLTGYCAYHEREYIYTDAASATLGQYFGESDPDTLRALDDFQVNNKAYRTKKALLNARQNIDALMASVPPLPKGIDKYIDNHVLRERRYLWYKKEGKTLVGLCTHCGKTCRTDKYPKGRLIGTRWKCPECGSEVEIKSLAGSANVRDHSNFSVVQNVPDGLMVTEYSVNRWNDRPDDVYGHSFKKLYSEHYNAICRAHIKYDGKTTYYIYEVRHNYLHRSTPQWYVYDGEHKYYSCTPSIKDMVFPGNVKRALANTPWKYSGLAELAKSDLCIDVSRYLNISRGVPALEKLSKLGLYRLALAVTKHGFSSDTANIIGWDRESTLPLDKLMRINKAELRMFREVDINEFELKLYKQTKENARTMTARDIKELRAAGIDPVLLISDAQHYRYILDYVTFHKLAKYATAQLALNTGWRMNNIITDWNDYLVECIRLGYDVSDRSVVMPQNLRTAHEQTSSLIQHKKNRKQNATIKKRCKAIGSLYALERDGYAIRMAVSADELVKEGKTQAICVGNYRDRYADGRCTILLLRKSEAKDTPFVTIEVREHPDHVEDVQIRGYRNGTPDEDTMKWWQKYKKDVLSKLGGKPFNIEHPNAAPLAAVAGS